MITPTLQVAPAWTELDDDAMTDVNGGGPLAEFVYDAVHTTVSAMRFVYDLFPRRGGGLAGCAPLSGGGAGGGW